MLDEIGQLGDGMYVSVAGGAQIFGDSIDTTSTGLLVASSPNRAGRSSTGTTDAIGPIAVIQPGRPNDIVNFGRVDKTPYIVGAILALLATATGVPSRHRPHVGGATNRPLRTSASSGVRCWRRGGQPTTLIAFALVVGIPIGRDRTFLVDPARRPAQRPTPVQVPWTGVALVVRLACCWPISSRSCLQPRRRTPPADSLRSE